MVRAVVLLVLRFRFRVRITVRVRTRDKHSQDRNLTGTRVQEPNEKQWKKTGDRSSKKDRKHKGGRSNHPREA